jgi:hypothetical protein
MNGAPFGIRNRGGGGYNPEVREHVERMFELEEAETMISTNRTKVEIHKKRDGFLLCRIDGSARFLGWWEGILYRLGLRQPEDFE